MSEESIEQSEVVKLIQDVLIGINAQYQARFTEFEAKIEKLEQQIATLVLAYGETTVFVESLVAQLAFATEEEQKRFTDNLSQNRKSMLEVMQSAAEGFLGSDSPVAGSTISNLVEQKLSDSSSD
jgi:hypothetical protein